MNGDQWKSIENFRPCLEQWGDPYAMDLGFVTLLDRMCTKVGLAFSIVKGYSVSADHHADCYHRLGQACDFYIPHSGGMRPAFNELKRLWWFGGIGAYPYQNPQRFHVDMGPPRQWVRDKHGDDVPIGGGSIW